MFPGAVRSEAWAEEGDFAGDVMKPDIELTLALRTSDVDVLSIFFDHAYLIFIVKPFVVIGDLVHLVNQFLDITLYATLPLSEVIWVEILNYLRIDKPIEVWLPESLLSTFTFAFTIAV